MDLPKQPEAPYSIENNPQPFDRYVRAILASTWAVLIVIIYAVRIISQNWQAILNKIILPLLEQLA